eukprot:2103253-Rhodomonas_salina.1
MRTVGFPLHEGRFAGAAPVRVYKRRRFGSSVAGRLLGGDGCGGCGDDCEGCGGGVLVDSVYDTSLAEPSVRSWVVGGGVVDGVAFSGMSTTAVEIDVEDAVTSGFYLRQSRVLRGRP